jgi:hypothetical protein
MLEGNCVISVTDLLFFLLWLKKLFFIEILSCFFIIFVMSIIVLVTILCTYMVIRLMIGLKFGSICQS